MFSRSRYNFGTSEHFETKMSFVAEVCVNFIKFDLFVTFFTWLHGCCYGQPSKIGLKYVFS